MSNSNSNSNKNFYALAKKRADNTELTDLSTYNFDNIIFDEPVCTERADPRGGAPQFSARITIATKNTDSKTEGDLVIECGRLRTYGIKESFDTKTDELTGYNVGMPLYEESAGSVSQSEDQLAIQTFFDKLVEKCKDQVLKPSVKRVVKRGDLERSDLKKISPIGFLKDKETQESLKEKPILSTKLIYSRSYTDKEGNFHDGKIKTILYQESDDTDEHPEINPLDILNKGGFIRPAIKIESIFINAINIKIQLKIHEGEMKIEERSYGPRKLLRFGGLAKKSMSFDFADEPSTEPTEESYQVPVKSPEPMQDEDEEESISIKKKKPVKKTK